MSAVIPLPDPSYQPVTSDVIQELDPTVFSWEKLGVAEDGLPTHLPMGVTETGEGPINDKEAHHWVCWCGQAGCPLTHFLQVAWMTGRKVGIQDAVVIVERSRDQS